MKTLSIIALLVLSLNANAATAYWTGQMKQAQSVTYQWGWNCQYNYAGNMFWVFFTGNCPNSIEIQ